MTFQIAKSVIDGLGFDYAAAVEDFRQAKLAHRFTGDVAPSAPAVIECAVRRVPVDGQADDFVADYEVVDDTPPPPTLAERKAKLVGAIRVAEAAAMAAVISPARERLMGLDFDLAMRKPESDRSDSDRALMETFLSNQARKNAVWRHGVLLDIEVEDLTEANIEAWTPKPFQA